MSSIPHSIVYISDQPYGLNELTTHDLTHVPNCLSLANSRYYWLLSDGTEISLYSPNTQL